MKFVDDFLNNITMYRLVLYFLIVLAGVGLIYSSLEFCHMTQLVIFFHSHFSFCFRISNWVFAKAFEAPTNVESWIISP